MSAKRLIWFQHMERAAGNSVVKLAELNGEHFFPEHHFTMPRDYNKRLIHIWNLSSVQLGDFIDRCFRDNVTFLSTVFGSPDIFVLSQDPRIVLITCFRNPLHRYASSFFYEYYNGTIPYSCSIERYHLLKKDTLFRAMRLENYYCRILSRDYFARTITETHYLKAQSALERFFYCSVIEQAGWISQLSKALNWKAHNVRTNASKPTFRRFLGYLKNRKPQLALRQLIHPGKPNSSFVSAFKERNKYDYDLYRAAQRVYIRSTCS